MATTIATFRDRIRSEVSGCPVPLIDEKVLDAIREFCEATHAVKKTILATEVPVDVGEYFKATVSWADHAGLSNYDPIMITDFKIDGSDYKIKEFNPDVNVDLDYVCNVSKERLYNFASVTSLEIYPFDDATSVDLTITLVLKPSLSLTSVDDVFYKDYRDGISAIALAHLQRMKDRPWTDIDQALINQGVAERKISEANFRKRMTYYPKKRTTGYI